MLLLINAIFLSFIVISAAACPRHLPVEIDGKCFRFTTDLLKFKDVRENCLKYDGMMTSVKSTNVLHKLEKMAEEYLVKSTKNYDFWIGLQLDDSSGGRKALKDRLWKWDYDSTHFVQKEYELWTKDGGPTDRGQTCASLNVSQNYLVNGVDCGVPQLSVLCMMDEGKTCKDDLYPYLMYGNYCIAGLAGAWENNKIQSACYPSKPTPYKFEMRDSVKRAAKNYFLGGAVFMNIRRSGDRFFDLSDGSQPREDWWEDGEPRDEYDCVGLSLQLDNTLRLRTINCEFYAASFCVSRDVPQKVLSSTA